MRLFLTILLLLAGLLAYAQEGGLGDPDPTADPPPVDWDGLGERLAACDSACETWSDDKGDYEAEIELLLSWADDIQVLAQGDPNEPQILVLLEQGDGHLLGAALELDLAGLDNDAAWQETAAGWLDFDAGDWPAADAHADAAGRYLLDRYEDETDAQGRIDEAAQSYQSANDLLSGV